jgi:hypothetical protein
MKNVQKRERSGRSPVRRPSRPVAEQRVGVLEGAANA